MLAKFQTTAMPSLAPGALTRLARALTVLVLTELTAFAADLNWDSNGNTAGFGSTTGTWGANAFWNDNPTGGAPTVAFTAATTNSDTVNFGTATLNYANGTIGVAAGGVTAGGIVIGGGQTTAITALGTSGNVITIHGGGISKNGGPSAVSFTSGITLGAVQTWTNNSTATLEVAENVISPNVNFVTNGGFQLTIDGTGTTQIGRSNETTHNSISGSGTLVKNGTGFLQLGGNNSAVFSGKITINGGVVNYGDSPASLGTGNSPNHPRDDRKTGAGELAARIVAFHLTDQSIKRFISKWSEKGWLPRRKGRQMQFARSSENRVLGECSVSGMPG